MPTKKALAYLPTEEDLEDSRHLPRNAELLIAVEFTNSEAELQAYAMEHALAGNEHGLNLRKLVPALR